MSRRIAGSVVESPPTTRETRARFLVGATRVFTLTLCKMSILKTGFGGEMSEPYGSFCPTVSKSSKDATNTATRVSGNRSLLNLYSFSTFYTLDLSISPTFLNYLQALLAITDFHDSTRSVVATRYTSR